MDTKDDTNSSQDDDVMQTCDDTDSNSEYASSLEDSESDESDATDEEVDESDDEEDEELDECDFTEDGETDDEEEEEQREEKLASTSSTSQVSYDSDHSDTSAESCPICLGRIQSSVGTPESCDHNFCLECILEWSKNVNTCPVDRKVYHLILAKHSLDGTVYKQIPIQDKQMLEEEEEDPTYCEICGHSDREDRMLLCDGCDMGFHMECLEPPLDVVPVEEWFCPDCAPPYRPPRRRIQERSSPADVTLEIVQLTYVRQTAPRRQIARTATSERVRATIAARRRFNRIESDDSEDEEVLPHDTLQRSRPVSVKNITKNTNNKRKRKRRNKKPRKASRKRRSKKTQKAGKRKRRSKKKKSSKLARTVKAAPVTSKIRLAGKLGITSPPTGRTIPTVKSKSSRTVESQLFDIGATSLSIFGSRDDLEYFPDDNANGEDIVGSHSGACTLLARPAAAAVRSRISTKSFRKSIIPLTSKQNLKSKTCTFEPEVSAGQPSFDLLSSIMQEQQKLHMKSEDIRIRRDGSLEAASKDTENSKNFGGGNSLIKSLARGQHLNSTVEDGEGGSNNNSNSNEERPNSTTGQDATCTDQVADSAACAPDDSENPGEHSGHTDSCHGGSLEDGNDNLCIEPNTVARESEDESGDSKGGKMGPNDSIDSGKGNKNEIYEPEFPTEDQEPDLSDCQCPNSSCQMHRTELSDVNIMVNDYSEREPDNAHIKISAEVESKNIKETISVSAKEDNITKGEEMHCNLEAAENQTSNDTAIGQIGICDIASDKPKEGVKEERENTDLKDDDEDDNKQLTDRNVCHNSNPETTKQSLENDSDFDESSQSKDSQLVPHTTQVDDLHHTISISDAFSDNARDIDGDSNTFQFGPCETENNDVDVASNTDNENKNSKESSVVPSNIDSLVLDDKGESNNDDTCDSKPEGSEFEKQETEEGEEIDSEDGRKVAYKKGRDGELVVTVPVMEEESVKFEEETEDMLQVPVPMLSSKKKEHTTESVEQDKHSLNDDLHKHQSKYEKKDSKKESRKAHRNKNDKDIDRYYDYHDSYSKRSKSKEDRESEYYYEGSSRRHREKDHYESSSKSKNKEKYEKDSDEEYFESRSKHRERDRDYDYYEPSSKRSKEDKESDRYYYNRDDRERDRDRRRSRKTRSRSRSRGRSKRSKSRERSRRKSRERSRDRSQERWESDKSRDKKDQDKYSRRKRKKSRSASPSPLKRDPRIRERRRVSPKGGVKDYSASLRMFTNTLKEVTNEPPEATRPLLARRIPVLIDLTREETSPVKSPPPQPDKSPEFEQVDKEETKDTENDIKPEFQDSTLNNMNSPKESDTNIAESIVKLSKQPSPVDMFADDTAEGSKKFDVNVNPYKNTQQPLPVPLMDLDLSKPPPDLNLIKHPEKAINAHEQVPCLNQPPSILMPAPEPCQDLGLNKPPQELNRNIIHACPEAIYDPSIPTENESPPPRSFGVNIASSHPSIQGFPPGGIDSVHLTGAQELGPSATSAIAGNNVILPQIGHLGILSGQPRPPPHQVMVNPVLMPGHPALRGLQHLPPGFAPHNPNIPLIRNRFQNGIPLPPPPARLPFELRPGLVELPPPPLHMQPDEIHNVIEIENPGHPPPGHQLLGGKPPDLERLTNLIHLQNKLNQAPLQTQLLQEPPNPDDNVFKVPLPPAPVEKSVTFKDIKETNENDPCNDAAPITSTVETTEVVDMDVASPLDDEDFGVSFSPPDETDNKSSGNKPEESNLLNKEDIPASAVELDVQSKFMKKLNRQERVVEEVKLAIKPHYSKGKINKEEYKEIMRKAVPKICHSKKGDINPIRIRQYIEQYVVKVQQARKWDAKKTGKPVKKKNKLHR